MPETPSAAQAAFDERAALFIGGRWVAPHGSRTLTVVDSNTEQPMGSVPWGTAADVDSAVAAARAAFYGWAATPIAERAAAVGRIAAALERRADALTLLIAREVGMPLAAARRIQVGFPVAQWKNYAAMGASAQLEERVGNSLVVREPVGVVAAITPWNYPLNQITLKVAPALLAGCTVVLKPSEVAPLNAFVLAEAIEEAGLPPGVFNLVTGEGADVGEALVAHPEVDSITFTGSTAAGKRVSTVAAQGVKRVSLELGGKSAALVLDSADLEAAVTATLGSCFSNSGQTCVAQTRLLVSRRRLPQAVEIARRLAAGFTVGSALDERSRLGPLVSQPQRERVRGMVSAALADGAELVTGGSEPPTGLERGYFVQPTVLVVADPRAAIAQEEVFGPVLVILAYEDEADAVRIANDSRYGLGGAVWAGTEAEAVRVARRLRTGQVNVNGGPFNMNAPFGGFKQSGHGREGGRYGLEEFLEYKALHLPVAP